MEARTISINTDFEYFTMTQIKKNDFNKQLKIKTDADALYNWWVEFLHRQIYECAIFYSDYYEESFLKAQKQLALDKWAIVYSLSKTNQARWTATFMWLGN